MKIINRLISGLVFLAITSVVLLTGYFALSKSVSYGDNNVELVAQVLDQRSGNVGYIASSADKQTTVVLASHSERRCPIADLASVDKTVSVVNFLVAMGQDSSFAKRVELAREFDIMGYTGSNEQNVLLLSKLKEKSGCYGLNSI